MTEVHFGPRALPRIDPTRAVTCRRSSAVPNESWAEKRMSGRRLTGLSVEDEIVLQFSPGRSEEHTSELQSLMRISYAVFCLKKKKNKKTTIIIHNKNQQ